MLGVMKSVGLAICATFLGSLGLILGASGCAPAGPAEPVREISEIRSELLIGTPAWRVQSARDGDSESLPRVEVVGPSLQMRREKKSYPTLLLPPPASVELGMLSEPQHGGELWLEGLAGADYSAWDWLGEHREAALVLEVDLEGERVGTFRFQATGAGAEEDGERAWEFLGGSSAGLRIESGDRLELRTRIEPEVADAPALKVGLGRLRVIERMRVQPQVSGPGKPNLVLIVMDTLRSDRTPSGDDGGRVMPHLAALAERGRTYTAAYSTASWTWPSTASILTGLQPAEHGVKTSALSYLNGELETLPEVLARGGIATAAFVGNPLIVPQQNFDQGFQTFEGTTASQMIDASELLDGALEWLTGLAPDERFFLYLHPTDPHEPLDHSAESIERFPGPRPPGYPAHGKVDINMQLSSRGQLFNNGGRRVADKHIRRKVREWFFVDYDRGVFTGDQQIGRLMEQLEALGVLENTLVVVTSDHGEELLDHGGLLHGHSLYRELTQVPLIVAGPGIGPGTESTPLSNRILAPSLARRMGLELDVAEDLPDLFELGLPGAQAVFFSEWTAKWNSMETTLALGVRSGRWMLHVAPELDKVRLFDLERDPLEQTNVADQHPERVAELRALAEQRQAFYLGRARSEGMGAGADTRSMLEEIGYIYDGE